ncbi:UNVERIFIED_CONTAM: TetR family transcriptional regulator [Williamsia faeni]
MSRRSPATAGHSGTTQAPDWLGTNRPESAASRILDVAGDLFVTHGVTAVNMNQIATAAGCSRATLYRYFASRSELHLAYVERQARRLSTAVSAATAEITDPGERITESILTAVAGVRSDPVMRSWFSPEAAGLAGAMGTTSESVNKAAIALITGETTAPEAELTLEARFIVRMVISLLMTPGSDAAEEREIVTRFVTPAILRRY